ncbi:MAG: chemotaxis protein CheW [Polaromonas sp.]
MSAHDELGPGQSRYGFEVSGLYLTAPAVVVTEAVAKATIYPVPKSAHALVGVINHRGITVPIFDLLPALGARTGLRPIERDILVFGQGEDSVGMLMNHSPVLMVLHALADILPKPGSPLDAYLSNPMVAAQSAATVWWDFDYQSAFKMLAVLTRTTAASIR